MGAESTSKSGGIDRTNKNYETEVVLNVYDLTPVNNYTYWFGFGIFHSGIEVHGKEYGFGAHDFAASGVFEVEPRKCPGFIYRCSISLGRINMPANEFRTFIESAASEYNGDTYHLISKNCNHFTDDISWRLTGKRVPGWVNRLARLGALCSCLLPESLQVSTVKQLPEYHEVSGQYLSNTFLPSESAVCDISIQISSGLLLSEDGSESLSSTPSRASAEIDDDQEKRLLSPAAGSGDMAFVKEDRR